jgi:regulator of CtrA degradation
MSAESIAQIDGNALAMRHLHSQSFMMLYRNVMALVEDLAQYLDVTGRQQSKSLSRETAQDYACLSRQLTTGALRVASALLILRAVKKGEMSFTTAMADINKKEMMVSPGGFTGRLEGLPSGLLELATRCDAIRLEVVRLVERLGTEGRSGLNPVHTALGLIDAAFRNN